MQDVEDPLRLSEEEELIGEWHKKISNSITVKRKIM